MSNTPPASGSSSNGNSDSNNSNPSEPPLPEGVTVTEYKHTYTELDGTQVIKRIIIKRIAPGVVYPTEGPAASSPNDQPAEAQSDNIDPEALNEFKRDVLKRHNELRELHGCPPLRMSREMCNYAQEWADHIAHSNIHDHRQNRKYGENIYWKFSPNLQLKGSEPVDHWYEEINLYDKEWYGRDPPKDSFKVSGHYTQIIWKETERIGVGLALNGSSFYVVANYDPHGNFFTKYKDNIFPPKNQKND